MAIPDPQALLPAFVSGFALQRALEIADVFVRRKSERWILGGSVVAALALVSVPPHMLIMEALNLPFPSAWKAVDWLISALVISAGTDGVNSIVKFLAYKKEETKQKAVSISDDTQVELE